MIHNKKRGRYYLFIYSPAISAATTCLRKRDHRFVFVVHLLLSLARSLALSLSPSPCTNVAFATCNYISIALGAILPAYYYYYYYHNTKNRNNNDTWFTYVCTRREMKSLAAHTTVAGCTPGAVGLDGWK